MKHYFPTGRCASLVQALKLDALAQAGKLRLVASRQSVEERFGPLAGLPAIQPHQGAHHTAVGRLDLARLQQQDFGRDVIRSEEHTSELQSLMRTSYAVFCFKKKN